MEQKLHHLRSGEGGPDLLPPAGRVHEVHGVTETMSSADEMVERSQSPVMGMSGLVFFIRHNLDQKILNGFRLHGQVREKGGKAVEVLSIPVNGCRTEIKRMAIVDKSLNSCLCLHCITSTPDSSSVVEANTLVSSTERVISRSVGAAARGMVSLPLSVTIL